MDVQRIIGKYDTGIPGPVFVAVGGMHGNEPGGIIALQRILEKLATHQLPLRGQFLALAGNRPAMRLNERFIDRDLNRRWFEDDLRHLLSRDPAIDSPEDREQREMMKIFIDLQKQASGPIVFLDLHSTSSGSQPFCAFADTLRNRKVAFALPIPMILGLEETIDGAMLGYLSDLGHIAVVVEGGQHTDPWTAVFLESATWLCLAAAGNLDAAQIPDYSAHHERLAVASRGLPKFVEIRYRHRVRPDDEFVMEPDYHTFQRISRNQLMAHDRHGAIRAVEGGRILMPLYQVQGEDGFFISRDVKRFWLWLSAVLRKWRLDRLVTWLPGVKKHATEPDQFTVNPRIARWFVRDIFHLFGFRRIETEDGRMVFSRRRPDFHPPAVPLGPITAPGYPRNSGRYRKPLDA